MRSFPLSILLVTGALVAGASAQKVLSAKEFVAKKWQLRAVAFTGSFASGQVYEIRAELKGFVGRGGQKVALLQTQTGALDPVLHSEAETLQTGISVRALAKLSDDGTPTFWAFADAAACEALDPTPKPPTQSATQGPNRQTLNSRSSRREPIFPNDLVKAYQYGILYFNPRMNPEKAKSIAQAVLYYSNYWGIDARLVMAVVACESGFKPNATSPRGAMGLGQLMPGTARSVGVTNPYDPFENLAGSIRIIRGHLERQKRGDVWDRLALALASYNAGSGAVRRYGGIPPYRETIGYVTRVVGLYKKLCGY